MEKKQARLRRARKTRAKIAELKVARLSVIRSNLHISAQIFSQCGSRVVASASSMESGVIGALKNGGNCDAAKVVGKLVAERAKSAGVEIVAFDRSGYRYHGRVKALAEAARENGLKF